VIDDALSEHPGTVPGWTLADRLPERLDATCLYDSAGWLRSWEGIRIEPRDRLAYVHTTSAALPLYVLRNSPFWRGYELQARLDRLTDLPMVFAGSTYSMYSRRGAVPAALVRGAHTTAMRWIADGDAGLLVAPNLTDAGVASWVDAAGPPIATVLLDRTYWCDLAGDFETHLARLPAKIRRDVQRRLRRGAERGLRVEMIDGPAAHDLVPAALPLTVGTTDEHDWPPLYDAGTLHGMLDVPGAVLAAALAGDRLVGVFFGFRRDTEVTYMCGGVEYRSLTDLSTYIALMYRCTEWCYQQGFRRIEWGRDNYRFKERHGLTGADLWALVYAPGRRPELSEALGRMHDTMCAYIGAV
jgi:hypothetical protein